MRIDTSKFCSLATSPSWQAWLFHFNADIYRRFIKSLQESRGCGQNRELMINILQEINKIDNGIKLGSFLQQHYPYMLLNDFDTPQLLNNDEIFEYYNPNILTYPRRMIFVGSPRELKSKVQSFLIDKIKSDFIIIGDKAYVEYLTTEDTTLKDQIPSKSWMIARWRSRKENHS